MKPLSKKCTTCGSAKIKVVRTDYVHRVRGQETLIPKLERQECSYCGEVLFDLASTKRLAAAEPKRKAPVIVANK